MSGTSSYDPPPVPPSVFQVGQAVNKFNHEHPIGTPVHYYQCGVGNKPVHQTEITGEAFVVFGDQIMCKVAAFPERPVVIENIRKR